MAFYRKSGSSNVTPPTVRRRSGSGWANVQTVRRRSSGSWVTVWTAYTPVSASTSPTMVTGLGAGVGTQTVNSGYTTTAGINGTGSYTFAWEKVSGTTLLVSAATSATTRFSLSLAKGATASAVYRCKVSDGTTSAYGPNVTINLSNQAL
jgi:hypothetical protein